MKYAKICMSFLLFCTSLQIGCKKELEEVSPQMSLNRDVVLSDPNAAMTLYYGVYASFRNYHRILFYLGELRSDIWAGGIHTESADATANQYVIHNINANNAAATNWGDFYSIIDKINTVIALFPSTTVEEPTRKKVMAEMYGLRAYIYYTMLKTWGRVPLTTEPVVRVGSLADLYKARSSEAEIMEQIKQDIDQSIQLFGTSTTFSAKRIFWNRAASLTLKGDIYLWSATHLGGGNGHLTIARQALEEVAGITTLGLQANYADVFDPTKKTNNKEIIFAINFELNEATQSVYNIFSVNPPIAGSLIFDPTTNPVVVSQAYPYVSGTNRQGMTVAMVQKLTANNDLRIRTTFRAMHSNNPPNYPMVGVLLTKFIGRVYAGAQLYDNDFPIYRYAEVLLMLAEAKSKMGADPSNEINAIRQRGYGASYTPYTNSTIDNNTEAVLDEYLREFIGEGKRWWAMRRAGDAWVFKYISNSVLPSGQTYRFLLPLSITMLNADPLLTQTPGY